jgi:hypothetical protein
MLKKNPGAIGLGQRLAGKKIRHYDVLLPPPPLRIVRFSGTITIPFQPGVCLELKEVKNFNLKYINILEQKNNTLMGRLLVLLWLNKIIVKSINRWRIFRETGLAYNLSLGNGKHRWGFLQKQDTVCAYE